MIGVSA